MPSNQPNSRLNAILSVQDLAPAELSSARLDGEIYAAGDSWCPIDVIDGPATRARAISLLVPVTIVAERSSAAWIYGLIPEPVCHELRLSSHARRHVAPSVRLRVREVRDPLAETLDLEGVRVTTPLRTAVDLALCRHQTDGDPDDERLIWLLAALLRYGGCPDIRDTLSRSAPAHSPTGLRAQDRFTAAQSLIERGLVGGP